MADSFDRGVVLVCVAFAPLRRAVFVEFDGVAVDAGVGLEVLLVLLMAQTCDPVGTQLAWGIVNAVLAG